MEDDLKDIDLIDRYLNNELDDQQQQVFKDRYLHDPEFKREVEVYEKIYEGIEKSTHDSLKQRLEGYYHEYIDEDLEIEEDTKVVSINRWRKTAWVLSGLAASVLLVAFGLWYYTLKNTDTSQQDAAVKQGRKMDSPAIKHNRLPVPTTKDDRYSLTDQQKANTITVSQVDYPQPLSYTFRDGLLSLYGDPLLGLIRLHVFKTGDQYFLWYDGNVYNLTTTTTPKKLDHLTGKTDDYGARSPENIKVQIEPLQALSVPSTAIKVQTSQLQDNRYFFTKVQDKWVLELQGNFVPKDCMVIHLKKDGKKNWYLINKSAVYLLDQHAGNPVPLKALPGMASIEARLLIKRDVVIVPVYVRK